MKNRLKAVLVERKFAGSGSTITPTTLLNYMHFSLLWSLRDYLTPSPTSRMQPMMPSSESRRRPFPLPRWPLHASLLPTATANRTSKSNKSSDSGSSSSIVKRRSPYDIDLSHPDCVKAALTQDDLDCAEILSQNFVPVNNRIFVNALYTHDAAARTRMRTRILDMADAIIEQFRGMLKTLTWMKEDTRRSAYSKLDNLVKNALYSEISFDDAALDAYYAPLLPRLAGVGAWLEQMRLVMHFSRTRELLSLTKPVDRRELPDTSGDRPFRAFTNVQSRNNMRHF